MSATPKADRAVTVARSFVAFGIVLVSAGAAAIYLPAGLIVAGACLLAIGIGALR